MNYKLVSGIFIFLWLVSGFYTGTGGITKLENDILIKKAAESLDTVKVIYDDISYKNKARLIAELETEQTTVIYPWLEQCPSFLAYMITACSFGLLGALISLFIELAFNNKELNELKYLSIPLLGILTGIVVLGISFIIPSLIITGDKDIKPEALVFLCLFCGIFSKKFYRRISNILDKTIEIIS